MGKQKKQKQKKTNGRKIRTGDSVNELLSYHVGTYTQTKTTKQHYYTNHPRIPSQQSKSKAHMLHKAKIERKLGSRTKASARERER